MAVTASGWYVQTFLGVWQQTISIDLGAETHKVAMFTNSITPNFDTDTAYGVAPYNANEVTGAGYTAGGTTLTSTTLTGASGTVTFDAANTSWASSSIGSARCALIHADANTPKHAIILVNFGADYSTTNGTFEIQWPGTGIGSFDITP